MIDARSLSFSYGKSPVLRDVSFTLPAGGFTALLGANGAGKTTLMRCLLGLEPRYTGSLLIGGREARDCPAERLARLAAYIPQTHYPAFNYTALDMVLMGTTRQLGALSSPGEKQRALALEAMERMGVSKLAGRGYARLSGGERQLVLIARALAQQAPLLVMDEPAASLDFGNQHRLLWEARALSQNGYTVLMSTHSPQHALSYADRVLALKGGALVANGAPRETLDEALLFSLYGVRARLMDAPGGRVILTDCGAREGEPR